MTCRDLIGGLHQHFYIALKHLQCSSMELSFLDTSSADMSNQNSAVRSHGKTPQTDAKRILPEFLEFFAGSGLVSQGLRGVFKPVWANDICPKKAAVYIANHSAQHFHLDSIANVKGQDLPSTVLAWASFPCQDLSLAGLTEGIHAARSGLVWQWLRIIDEMAVPPPLLVAENVAGLVSAAGGSHYRTLHQALTERGYLVGAMLIDAAHWVPQSRQRVFVVAIKSDVKIPKVLTSHGPTWLHPDSVCKATIGVDEWVWWNMPAPSTRGKTLSDIVEWDAEFADSETEARNIRLISPRHAALLNALPNHKPFAAPGYKRTRNGKQVLELRFDDLAGCLRTPGGGSSRQVLVIRENGNLRSRLLTVREAARLMGAPENYKIPGSYNDGYKAMGDAVAVPVARWLASKLLFPLAVAIYEQNA